MESQSQQADLTGAIVPCRYGHPNPLVSFDDTNIQTGIEDWEPDTDAMLPTFEPTNV